MTWRRAIWCAAILVLSIAGARGQSDTIVKAVEPDYGTDAGKPMISTLVGVRLVINRDGTPLGLDEVVGQITLPVMNALMKYRFKPAKATYKVELRVPVKIPAESFFVFPRSISLAGQFSSPSVTDAKASDFEKSVKPGADGVTQRAELIAWAATHDDERGRGVRARQIEWLVRNEPTAPVLRSTAAVIRPDEDAATYTTVRGLWLDLLAKNPGNLAYLEGASNFLRIHDPAQTLRLLNPYLGRVPLVANWMGDVLAVAGLGITHIDRVTGRPVLTDGDLAASPLAASARESLIQAKDATMLFSGFQTLHNAAQQLLTVDRIPAVFDNFCAAVLKRVKEIKPNGTETCELRPVDSRQGLQPAPGEVSKGTLVKALSPIYPEEAKKAGIEGTVRLHAIITKQGKVSQLRTVSGPAIFYAAAIVAVLQWEYRPYVVNGEPVDVDTEIEVNFNLR